MKYEIPPSDLAAIVKAFEEIEKDYGVTCQVSPTYSGRHMFGECCVGFITNKPLAFLMAFASILTNSFTQEEFEPFMEDVQQDSMGKTDTIVYFPNVTLGEDEDFLDDPDAEFMHDMTPEQLEIFNSQFHHT